MVLHFAIEPCSSGFTLLASLDTTSMPTTVQEAPSTNAASPALPSGHPRVGSVDIFRGFDLLLMIFVNSLADATGLPWWTYHRGNVNGMTYVDMVFPAFLFLMGMSIPLAIDARRSRGQSALKVCTHIVIRSASLLVMGLFIANAFHVNAQYTHLNQTWWASLGFLALTLVWLRFPGEAKRPILREVLRYSGLTLMAVLFLMFRRVTPEGLPARLDFSYVEILGLLGWAYLLVSGIYLVIGKRFKMLLAAFAALVALNIFSTLGWLHSLNDFFGPWNPFESGLSSLTMAGVLASMVIVGDDVASSFQKKLRWMFGAAAVLFALGYLLQPLGISKNHDTPTWCLYCTAANFLIALLLFWIIDVKNRRAWANFAKPVGENPLLAYLLAYVPFLVPPLYPLTPMGTSGWFGVVKSVLLMLLMLVLTRLLVRARITLRV
jgi:heparan-alpha-glucosaminide N-acetyltransferase